MCRAVKQSTFHSSRGAWFVLEMDGRCAAAAAVGKFYLYLPTMPRVADFLRARHGIPVFAKEQTCVAVRDAVLLSDDGLIYPCSMARVSHPEFGVALGDGLAAEVQAGPIQDLVAVRREKLAQMPCV